MRLFCEVFVRLSDALKRVGCQAAAAASRVVAVKTVLEYPSVVVEHSLRFVINLVNLSPRGRVDEVVAVFLVLAPMTTWLYFGVLLLIFVAFASGDIIEVLLYFTSTNSTDDQKCSTFTFRRLLIILYHIRFSRKRPDTFEF